MTLENLEKKAISMEIRLQRLLKINRKEDQKEIRKLHFDLNLMWKEIAKRSK